MGRSLSRRVVVTRYGGPEVLEVREGPVPEPRRGEVRVRVARVGVAFGDAMRRKGVLAPRAPFTPGYDVVGVAEGDPAWDGVRVAALLPRIGIGAYAEEVCVPVRDLVRVPDGLDDDTAVALGMNYISAWQIIHRVAKLSAGQRLFVQGASGGVGTALLDVARQAGLAVAGTASASKHDVVRSFGAEPVDYRTEDVVKRILQWSDGGVDAAADPIGGPGLDATYATVRPGGMLVFFGFTADIDKGIAGLLAGLWRVACYKVRPDGRRVRSYGVGVPFASSRSRNREDLERVLSLAHAFRPLIGGRFELGDAAEAHRTLESGRSSGKLVLYVRGR